MLKEVEVQTVTEELEVEWGAVEELANRAGILMEANERLQALVRSKASFEGRFEAEKELIEARRDLAAYLFNFRLDS